MKLLWVGAVLAMVGCGKQPPHRPEIGLDSAIVYAHLASDFRSFECHRCTPGCRPREEFPGGVDFSVLAGAPVRRVRVLRVLDRRKPKQVDPVRALTNVWGSKSDGFEEYVNWSEGQEWWIYAEIDFEGGRKGSILTDGGHVQLQDSNGCFVFTIVRMSGVRMTPKPNPLFPLP